MRSSASRSYADLLANSITAAVVPSSFALRRHRFSSQGPFSMTWPNREPTWLFTSWGARQYLAAARCAIPQGYEVANETPHPNFLTADFALVRSIPANWCPGSLRFRHFRRSLPIRQNSAPLIAKSSICRDRSAFFSADSTKSRIGICFVEPVIGDHSPENVVLTEVDPLHPENLSRFFRLIASAWVLRLSTLLRSSRLATNCTIVTLEGRLTPIHRIYNRAIADELIAREIHLSFDLSRPWDVEWAGHPNWYFLISKFSIPWLSRSGQISGCAARGVCRRLSCRPRA